MEYFKWCKFLFEIITGKTGIATFLKTDSYIFFSYQLGQVLRTKFYRVINSYVFRWLNNRELLTRQKTFEYWLKKWYHDTYLRFLTRDFCVSFFTNTLKNDRPINFGKAWKTTMMETAFGIVTGWWPAILLEAD